MTLLEILKKMSVGKIYEAERASKRHGKHSGAFMEGFRFARNNLQDLKGKAFSKIKELNETIK